MLYQTIARIHLDHIRFNIEGIRKAIGSNRKLLLAVKANAYGHGAVAVSQMAERMGVDWLGVVTVPEGIQLREAGISLPILKFSQTFAEEMQVAVGNRITLTVCDQENITQLESVCQGLEKRVNVHLKVDTGMGTIGVTPEDAPKIAWFIEQKCPHLYLEGIFTHLPVSDDGDLRFTDRQIDQFKDVVANVQTEIQRKISCVHCANSGGVLGHPDSWLDLVRPGVMIYGYYPGEDTPQTIPLKPGMSFVTRVTFMKKVPAGTSIGYGRTWTAEEDSWIATISAGYADGFNRLFSNSGRVLIRGKSYPIVGRVCMDQSMVNLGVQTDASVGDEVILIGKSGDEEISVYEWARKLKTITYEVTCQVSARVPRVYEGN